MYCSPDLGPPAACRAGAGQAAVTGPARMGWQLQEMSLAGAPFQCVVCITAGNRTESDHQWSGDAGWQGGGIFNGATSSSH